MTDKNTKRDAPSNGFKRHGADTREQANGTHRPRLDGNSRRPDPVRGLRG